LKPGGLREMHWHPNEDERQYYIKGEGRMTVFAAGGPARTTDFQEGDVGLSMGWAGDRGFGFIGGVRVGVYGICVVAAAQRELATVNEAAG